MSHDIIWALVALSFLGVSAWLIDRVLLGKRTDAKTRAIEVILGQHSSRLDVIERALVAAQKDVLGSKEAITRIENRLGPDVVTKVGRKWPGGG